MKVIVDTKKTTRVLYENVLKNVLVGKNIRSPAVWEKIARDLNDVVTESNENLN